MKVKSRNHLRFLLFFELTQPIIESTKTSNYFTYQNIFCPENS